MTRKPVQLVVTFDDGLKATFSGSEAERMWRCGYYDASGEPAGITFADLVMAPLPQESQLTITNRAASRFTGTTTAEHIR